MTARADLIRALAMAQGLLAEQAVESVSLTIWCALHGFATLVFDSPIGKSLDAQSVAVTGRRIWQQLYQGLKPPLGTCPAAEPEQRTGPR